MWVLAPTGEILSFASPKESIQRKSDPLPLNPCASRLRRELIEGTFLCLDKCDSSLNRPFGLFPTKTAMLGAAEGKYYVGVRKLTPTYTLE